MRLIIEGLMLGLSTGAYCIGMCLAFFMPYLLAEGKPQLRENLKKIALFMLGRLIAYLSFALIIGFLGAEFKNFFTPLEVPAIGGGGGLLLTGFTDKIAHLSLIAASLLMLVYALTHKISKSKSCDYFFGRFNLKRLPFFLGLFSGLSPCLPFLLGITRLWTLHSIFAGAILFIGFFLGTSVYMFPLLFVSFFNRIDIFKQIGLVAALLSGLWFLFIGISGLAR